MYKVSIFVIVLLFTLDLIPPPIIYLTVRVVFAGDSPYDLVYRKFEGSLGSGVISKSEASEAPGPNWISKSPLALKRDTNLFGTFFIFKR